MHDCTHTYTDTSYWGGIIPQNWVARPFVSPVQGFDCTFDKSLLPMARFYDSSFVPVIITDYITLTGQAITGYLAPYPDTAARLCCVLTIFVAGGYFPSGPFLTIASSVRRVDSR